MVICNLDLLSRYQFDLATDPYDCVSADLIFFWSYGVFATNVNHGQMSYSLLFQIVEVTTVLLPIVFVVMAVYFLPSGWRFATKALHGMVISWLALILFNFYIYNPVGIAAGHEVGMHFPEARYDNNTIATALLFGWFPPLFWSLVLYILLRLVKPSYLRKQK